MAGIETNDLNGLMTSLCNCKVCGNRPTILEGDLICESCGNTTHFEVDYDYASQLMEDFHDGPIKNPREMAISIIHTLWSFKMS